MLQLPQTLDDLPPRLVRNGYRILVVIAVFCCLLFAIPAFLPRTGDAVLLRRSLLNLRWCLLMAVPVLLLAFSYLKLIYSMIEGGPWVTQRVRATRRRLQGQSVATFARQELHSKLKSVLNAYILPSRLGTLLAAIPALLVLVPLSLAPHPGPANHDQYLALWQVHAGLAVAALPILVTVIELSRDDPALAQRQFAVLVRYTWAFPNAVFVVTAAFVSALGGFWLWSSWSQTIGLVLFTASLVATVFPFLQLLRLHSDRARLEARSLALLKERFQRSLDDTTDARVAAFIMQDCLDGAVAAYSFLSPKGEGYHALDAPTVSHVVDVHLALLEKFIRNLPPKTVAPDTDVTRLVAKPALSDPASGPKLVITRLVGDQTFEQDPALAFLKGDLANDQSLADLRERFLSCYKLADPPPDSPDLQRHLEELRTSVIHTIRARDEVVFRRRCSVYVSLIETFLDHIQCLGIRYGRDESEQETNAILVGRSWREIEWLHQNYVELLREGFRHRHPDILRRLLYFPYSVAARALSARDFYTIHLFLLGTATLPYSLNRRCDDADTCELVMNRLHRHPVDFLRFIVRPHLEAATQSDAHFLADVLEGVVTVLNRRLKAAFDEGNLDDFTAFTRTLQTAIADLERVEVPFGLAPDPTVRMRRLASVSRFGIYSWIVAAYLRDEMDVGAAKAWLDACEGFGDIDEFLQTYGDALTYELQERLDWLQWEIEGRESGNFVNIEPRLHDGFLVYVLRRRGEHVSAIHLPSDTGVSRTLGNVTAEGGGVWEALERLDRRRVDSLLNGHGESSRAKVKTLLRAVHQHWSNRWRKVVVTSSIDEAKRSQFRDKVVEGFGEGSPLRWLLLEAERSEILAEADHEEVRTEWRGFNHLIPKEDFLSDSTTITDVYAADLGRQLAREGEEKVVARIVDGAGRHRDIGAENCYNVLMKEAQLLRKQGYRPSIILIGRWNYFRDLAPRLKWRRSAGTNRTGYMGELETVNFYESYARKTVGALVVDVSRALTWRDYRPPAGALAERLESPVPSLTFGLNEIDADALRDAIEENPEEWLKKDERGDVETPEQALVRLQQKVQFRAFTRVDCNVDDGSAVVYVSPNGMSGRGEE